MAIGKRLLIFSPNDPQATSLAAQTAEWGCLVTSDGDRYVLNHEFRGTGGPDTHPAG